MREIKIHEDILGRLKKLRHEEYLYEKEQAEQKEYKGIW